MLRVDCHSEDSISLCSIVISDDFRDYHDGLAGWYTLSPISIFINGTLSAPCVLSCREAIGRVEQETTRSIEIRGGKAVHEDFSGEVDDWRFGWRGFPPIFPLRRPNIRCEQEVLHPSYSGSGRSGTKLTGPYYSDVIEGETAWGVEMPKRFSRNTFCDKISFINDIPLFGPSTVYGGRKHYADDIREALNGFTDFPLMIVDSSPSAPHMIRIDSIYCNTDNGYLDVIFRGEFRLFPFGTNPYTYDKWWGIPFSERLFTKAKFPPDATFEPIVSPETTVPRSEYERGFRLGEFYAHNLGPAAPDSFKDLSGLSGSWSGDLPLVALGNINRAGPFDYFDPKGVNIVLNDWHLGLTRFTSQIQTDMYRLLPATFYSSSDAIMKHIDVIQANYIESLSELGEIASLIPDISNFVSFITSARRGEWLKAGNSLAKTWSEFQLQWDFGIKPAISDIAELSNKMDILEQRMREERLWGHQTLYGKFNWTMPGGRYGLDKDVRFTFRSKVDTSFNRSSLFAAILKGKAAGLLPTMSSLWDLVPFSFVVDWFGNIGGRLEQVEAQAFMLCLPCNYTVHSVLAEYAWSSDELEERDLTISLPGQAGPGMRFYYRMPSARFPKLFDAGDPEFDFQAAQGPHSLITAGALVLALAL